LQIAGGLYQQPATNPKEKKMKKRKPRQVRKKRSTGRGSTPTGKAILRYAGQWPLLECIITADWREPGEIIQLCVARQSPLGDVVTGAFVIDLGCLGVKNAYAAHFNSAHEYRRELRSRLTGHQKMIACDLDLAAKVVKEAIRYAGSLGFRPNRDTGDALKVMGATRPENCTVEIPLGGEDGRPFFIAGPFDDPDRIMRILDRKVGRGNYHFMAPIGPPGLFDDEFDEMDEWDEADEDDED
jgi:hypothetical protein